MRHLDTIMALLTPPGTSPVAIIRVSGPETPNIIQILTQKPVPTPRYSSVRTLYNTAGQRIDQACVLFFKQPAAYTGEDSAELHLHGNPVIIQSIREVLYALGVREADPGEFTRRAFMNGKLDLTQAESVHDAITAPHAAAHQRAMGHLDGQLSRFIAKIRSNLQALLECLTGHLDFPNEVPVPDDAAHQVQAIRDRLAPLLMQNTADAFITRAIRCLILGEPNVGKSSLFNRLIGTDRSIVTAEPGTTRDYITATLSLGSYTYELIDSAGVRQTDNAIEQAGITYSYQLLDYCDCVLWVRDTPEINTDIHARIQASGKPVYQIINKQDRVDQPVLDTTENWPIILTSAQTDTGLDTLMQALRDLPTLDLACDTDLVCNARQKACLHQVDTQLQTVQATLDTALDIAAHALHAAVGHCAAFTGECVTETVLDGIFSRFCVGK